MIVLNSLDKSVLRTYVTELRRYKHDNTLTVTKLTAKEADAIKRVGQLVDLYEANHVDWVNAQIYWWHEWFVKFPSIEMLASMTRRKDSVWRYKAFQRVRGTCDYSGRPTTPMKHKENDLSFVRAARTMSRNLETAVRNGIDPGYWMLNNAPGQLFYLVSPKAVRLHSDQYMETFNTIKHRYLDMYKNIPGIGKLGSV